MHERGAPHRTRVLPGLSHDKEPCLLCRRRGLHTLALGHAMPGVTSDCKAWSHCSPIVICIHCGHVQKRPDADWRSAAAAIYAHYDIYHLSGGVEQAVFQNSAPIARSTRLLEHFRQHVTMPERGHLLEVGCGNGAMLRSFGRVFPFWTLAGAEQNDHYREVVRQIPGVLEFYSGPLDAIERTFDLIILLHVLEHVDDVGKFLSVVGSKLSSDGRLFIQVPNFHENPFDLMVVDHCSHFIPQTLLAAVVRSGFTVVTQATDWISKEISLVLRRTNCLPPPEVSEPDADDLLHLAQQRLSWLDRVLNHAREAAASGPLGIFGTAIAGTWLASALGPNVQCFVDEDPTRAGKMHIGMSVLSPEAVPPGTRVYLAVSPQLAAGLRERLQRQYPSLTLITPPAF